jgi:PKD repeat protein
VRFANTSAGDYTTSQWTFGDGATSSQAAPTHVYPSIGTYTVTLTIGDGVETNTITRTHYIATRYRVFAPLVVRE